MRHRLRRCWGCRRVVSDCGSSFEASIDAPGISTFIGSHLRISLHSRSVLLMRSHDCWISGSHGPWVLQVVRPGGTLRGINHGWSGDVGLQSPTWLIG